MGNKSIKKGPLKAAPNIAFDLTTINIEYNPQILDGTE